MGKNSKITRGRKNVCYQGSNRASVTCKGGHGPKLFGGGYREHGDTYGSEVPVIRTVKGGEREEQTVQTGMTKK